MILDPVKNAFKIPDLRKKILYTLFIILIFEIGSVITVPFMNAETLKSMFSLTSEETLANSMFGYLNLLSGGGMQRASLFAMSVSPYINASIIIQLLTYAIPALERLQKEGEEGRKKISMITRYVSVVLGIVEAIGYFFILDNYGALETGDYNKFFVAVVIVASFTAGSAMVMWLGERINQKGIGNGISIILFVSIATQFPTFVVQIFQAAQTKLAWGVIILLIFAVMIVLIVAMNDGERRIPVQYAKKVVGRKMYGGQSTFLPLKVTMSGVLPIIFASAFVSMPSLIASFFPNSEFAKGVNTYFGHASWAYAVVYFILIIAFNFFYVSVQYNPVEMANNIQKNGGFVFGLRPGAPTADYIKRVLNKITIVGAACLAFIAIVPIFYQMGTQIQVALGGTSIIIVVGVILETLKQLESQMLMRHYKGFLD